MGHQYTSNTAAKYNAQFNDIIIIIILSICSAPHAEHRRAFQESRILKTRMYVKS